MNDLRTAPRLPMWQFSLGSLLAVTTFTAMALFGWRSSGFLGVAFIAVLVSIVAANMAIAVSGAKSGRAVMTGVLGGAALWSILGLCLTMLDGRNPTVEVLGFGLIGVIPGFVCGSYARRKQRPIDEERHKGTASCVVLIAALGTCLALHVSCGVVFVVFGQTLAKFSWVTALFYAMSIATVAVATTWAALRCSRPVLGLTAATLAIGLSTLFVTMLPNGGWELYRLAVAVNFAALMIVFVSLQLASATSNHTRHRNNSPRRPRL